MTEESRSWQQQKALSSYVNRRVLGLQSQYLQGNSSARGRLEQIRHIDRRSGSAWSLFDILETQDTDDNSGRADWDAGLLGEPSETNRAFIAAISALTLFAERIQSETSPVADADWHHSFGAACQMIGSKNGKPVETDNLKGVLRRLTQLESAQDFKSVEDILRRLTHLMRKQPYCVLDFGRLAVDLWQIQCDSVKRHHVFFGWAKDFYRIVRSDQNSSDSRK